MITRNRRLICILIFVAIFFALRAVFSEIIKMSYDIDSWQTCFCFVIGFVITGAINSRMKYAKFNWVYPMRIASFLIGSIVGGSVIIWPFLLVFSPSHFLKMIHYNWVDILVITIIVFSLVRISSWISKNNLKIELNIILKSMLARLSQFEG
ncbi:MAG: hypothetical protein FJ264_18280 [Planctomycetes bacterium]|nr:hypothetical protein [Planctomycetota bacterium]MBM4067280.1 hypothetical protein [Planctomycetota bacterium]